MSGVQAAVKALFGPNPDEGSSISLVKEDWMASSEASLRTICKGQRDHIKWLEKELAEAWRRLEDGS